MASSKATAKAGKTPAQSANSAPLKRARKAAAPTAAGAADTATKAIVSALTRAITEHRLEPGTKLGEQRLADHHGVSRTLVRQALFQMVQNGLIRMEPARGAFVAEPSREEARQVFATRRMVEAGLCREVIAHCNPAKLKVLREHLAAERAAVQREDAGSRVELLGDFHVVLALLIDNTVLAELLKDLISRCALIMLVYQSAHAAHDSYEEHTQIVQAFADKDEARAVRLMDEHLRNVEASLDFTARKPAVAA